jgi:hypothetical protein
VSSTSDVAATLLRLYRSRFAFWLALPLCVLFGALVISTFVLDSAIIPGPAVFFAFPLIFVLHGCSIMKVKETLKNTDSGMQAVRTLLKWWAPLVFFPFWFSSLSGMSKTGVAAEERDGKYVATRGGVERVVPKEEAIQGNLAQLRVMSSIFGMFSALGLIASVVKSGPESPEGTGH